MKKSMIWCGAIGVFAMAAGTASADIVQPTDPGIFSPFDNAQVYVSWISSDAGYTGELQWIDTAFEGGPQTLWTNKSATSGQQFELTRLFSAGERVDFRYEIIAGGIDLFSTGVQNDWAQFSVDASDPLDVIVGIEDIRYPDGDMDHNDAIFRVSFSQATVPAPGAFALMGLGGLLVSGRRTR
jgi:hypothetical protein